MSKQETKPNRQRKAPAVKQAPPLPPAAPPEDPFFGQVPRDPDDVAPAEVDTLGPGLLDQADPPDEPFEAAQRRQLEKEALEQAPPPKPARNRKKAETPAPVGKLDKSPSVKELRGAKPESTPEKVDPAPAGRLVEEVEFRARRYQHVLTGPRSERLEFRPQMVRQLGQNKQPITTWISILTTQDPVLIEYLRERQGRDFSEYQTRMAPAKL